jgi:hypothetical protein
MSRANIETDFESRERTRDQAFSGRKANLCFTPRRRQSTPLRNFQPLLGGPAAVSDVHTLERSRNELPRLDIADQNPMLANLNHPPLVGHFLTSTLTPVLGEREIDTSAGFFIKKYFGR